MEEYLVPTAFGEDEFIEKKSRFIGRAWPVETEEETKPKKEKPAKDRFEDKGKKPAPRGGFRGKDERGGKGGFGNKSMNKSSRGRNGGFK